jgi:four helix bundle protein
MTEAELKRRTKRFALRVMKLVTALPRGVVPDAIGRQLVRSGTSVGANYHSACRGRSRAEFVAKMGIAEEEADESGYWLELTMEDGLLPEDRVRDLHKEAGELAAILASSRMTAAARAVQSKLENRKSKMSEVS